MTEIVSLDGLARRIAPHSRVAVPADYAGVAMAATAVLVLLGTGGLRLVCVPTGGLQVDMLIGAGLVAEVETSAVSLGEAGGAPAFNRAVREGSVRVVDATCPAVHAGLMAAQKGVPFMPIRGLLGTDVLANRTDWRVLENPFAQGGASDPIVLVPAIHVDFALFHVPLADLSGNVWIGRRRELATMAYAAKRTLVTVERLCAGSLLEDERTAAGVLPSLYVDAVAEAPGGALPYGLWGEYPADTGAIAGYAKAARTPEGLASYISEWATKRGRP